MRLLCALLLFAAPVLAQPVTPAPAANEDPADLAARVRYERAMRAEFDGRREDALREARACLEAKADGRFADAARSLVQRLETAAPPQSSSGVGPRTELVISSTLSGLYISSLIASATNAGSKGSVAWLMLGTGGALVGSIWATSGRHVPQSMPQMLQNGVGYGSWAAIIEESFRVQLGSRNPEGVVAAGALAGGIAGLVASPWLTGGDSGAMSAAMIYGGALPTALLYVVSGDKTDSTTYRWTALAGATAGIFAGPLLNSRLHWSRGRWNLVTLGGGVGALMGGGLAVLSDSTGQGAAALVTAGAVVGLGLTGWLTHDFGDDEPHAGSAALLHVEDGKLSLGNVPAAVSPTRVQDKSGAFLSLVDGRF